MPWLHHPKYVPVRDALIVDLKRHIHVFSRPRPIIFLCGGNGSERRIELATYLKRHTSSLVFFAEEVWEEVASDSGTDALALEESLADLSDMVVVIAESPGTFAELGAFSLHKRLQRKLLPILDDVYRNEQSFVNTGPIRTVQNRSLFAPAVYTDFRVILRAASVIEQRLGLIPIARKQEQLTAEKIKDNRRNLLLFLVHLVGFVFPVTLNHLKYYVTKVFGSSRRLQIRELLQLAVSLGLVASRDCAVPGVAEPMRFFAPIEIPHLVRSGDLHFAATRARIAGALMGIEGARVVIGHMEHARADVPS